MKTVDFRMDTEMYIDECPANEELASFVQAVVEQLKREQKYAAVHGYLAALHSFEDFARGRGMSLLMKDVFMPEQLKAYEEWLMQRKERPLKANSVTSYMSSLRAVYNRWMPAGTPGHNPKLFAHVHTRVVSKTKRALRGWQLEKMLNTDTRELSPEEKTAFDYFRLMFLLRGLPFIDLAHMRRHDLQGKYLYYLRHKTGKPMCVELCPDAMKLLRELMQKDSDSPYLFPILDADVQGGWEQHRNYQTALRNFNRMLKKAMKRLLPGVPVSSYTARHSWATLAYHMGFHQGVISQALGHSSVVVTETYLKPFENKRLDKANRQLISAVKNGKWRSRMSRNTF